MSFHIAPVGDCFAVKDADGETVGGPFVKRERAAQKLRQLNKRDPEQPETAKRKCMCCPTMFRSQGAHHRMCDRCRQKSQPVAL